MQLITLHKTVTAGFATEAYHDAEIHGKLSEGIRGQLVNLHPKLQQDIS
jgi:hypothetical protein